MQKKRSISELKVWLFYLEKSLLTDSICTTAAKSGTVSNDIDTMSGYGKMA